MFGDFLTWGVTEEDTVMKFLKNDTKQLKKKTLTPLIRILMVNLKSFQVIYQEYNILWEIIILTKGYCPMSYNNLDFSMFKYGIEYYPEINYVNSQRLSRKHIINAVEHSVKSLGTHIVL